MKTATAISPLILAALTTLTACGDPCLPTVLADTSIIPAADECDIPNDSDSGSGSSSTTTADPVTPLDPKPGPLPVCIAIPGAGEEWGPCVEGQCDDGLLCKVSGMGDVCLAACDVPGPCNTDLCAGATCDMDLGACIAPCKAVGDPCPLPDMQCVFGAAPLCVNV